MQWSCVLCATNSTGHSALVGAEFTPIPLLPHGFDQDKLDPHGVTLFLFTLSCFIVENYMIFNQSGVHVILRPAVH